MQPKRSFRVPRKLLAVVVVLAATAAALLWAQNSTVLVPDMSSYRVLGPRSLSVRVAVAPCSWTRVTEVVETPDSVRVKVETLPCPNPLPGTDELTFRDLTVTLTADLATRVVEDASGQAVHLGVAERPSPDEARPTYRP
jgi:hypothetical protein